MRSSPPSREHATAAHSEPLNLELLLFSGSTCIESGEEERVFCRFLGLRPLRRTIPSSPDGATTSSSTAVYGMFVPKRERAAPDSRFARRCHLCLEAFDREGQCSEGARARRILRQVRQEQRVPHDLHDAVLAALRRHPALLTSII